MSSSARVLLPEVRIVDLQNRSHFCTPQGLLPFAVTKRKGRNGSRCDRHDSRIAIPTVGEMELICDADYRTARSVPLPPKYSTPFDTVGPG
jgi:hypothetical protein